LVADFAVAKNSAPHHLPMSRSGSRIRGSGASVTASTHEYLSDFKYPNRDSQLAKQASAVPCSPDPPGASVLTTAWPGLTP
jgi:hypothetical protein